MFRNCPSAKRARAFGAPPALEAEDPHHLELVGAPLVAVLVLPRAVDVLDPDVNAIDRREHEVDGKPHRPKPTTTRPLCVEGAL